MSMATVFHSKQSEEFRARGYATQSTYSGLYPVLNITKRDVIGAGEDEITLFATPEQLMQIRTAITAALRDYNKQKLELNRLEKIK